MLKQYPHCKHNGGYTEGYICRICHKQIYSKQQLVSLKHSQIQVNIGVSSKPHAVYTTNLKKWLSKELSFEYIDYAKFTNKMRLATIEFDKNNTIYVLIPEDVFSPSIKWVGDIGGDPLNPFPLKDNVIY